MGKSPAFQLFCGDWLSSQKITLMSSSEEGAYVRLLCYAWMDPDCSLPDDDDVLAQLSRLGEQWSKGSSRILRACFTAHPHKPGRLVNTRLLIERQRQEEWRKKCRLGGIQSGKSRTSSLKGSSRVVEVNGNRPVELEANSSSSSSLNSYRERKGSRNELNGHGPSFEAFWKVYPRKEGKGACRRWWIDHKPDDVLLGIMLSKIEQAKQTPKWNEHGGKFIPMPATWLNQERWEDEYRAASQRKGTLPL